MELNGTLSFKVNDINYGIACSSIPNDIQLYPVINICDLNQIVEIIDYWIFSIYLYYLK